MKALKTVSRLSTLQTYNGLSKSLLLKVGAKNMLKINIDTADDLTNGSTGVLMAIDFAINKKSNPVIGNIKRNEAASSPSRYKNRVNKNWTPLEPATYTIK